MSKTELLKLPKLARECMSYDITRDTYGLRVDIKAGGEQYTATLLLIPPKGLRGAHNLLAKQMQVFMRRKKISIRSLQPLPAAPPQYQPNWKEFP